MSSPSPINERPPAIRIEVESSPDALTLVRGMLGGASELLAVDAELLDDLKTAISEACNNVVIHAYDGGAGPLEVMIYLDRPALEVVVRDAGKGMAAPHPSEDRVQGVGLPIIHALSNEASISALPEGGTEVRMVFEAEREGRPLLRSPGEVVPEDGWLERMSGDAVVSVSPVNFLGGVLGRLARALAAKARFSLDRFSDVYLVTDTIAAHAYRSASSERIAFGVGSSERQLELAIGPFRAGTGARLISREDQVRSSAPLSALSDEVDVRGFEDAELLRVVMRDHSPSD